MTRIDQSIVERYPKNYRLSGQERIDPTLIQAHWDLERRLRAQILESNAEERWQHAEQAYSDLYAELKWHDALATGATTTENYAKWTLAVGPAPCRIYEIGSGQGALLRKLASLGHVCRGTEITRHRGEVYVSPQNNLTWGNTDGVHLDQFESCENFDVLLSNQVIEHLHREDLDEHLRSAWRLLVPGGCYVLSTPHWLTGPHDLSLVFSTKYPEGLHLKEYSWHEMALACRSAGFETVRAATTVGVAETLRNRLAIGQTAELCGGPYLQAMELLESSLGSIPHRRSQQHLARSLKRLRIFADNIFLIATKS